MEVPIKVSLISYTNTKPFVLGLLKSTELKNQIQTSFDSPAECARKLVSQEVDLGIVPVASLKDIPDYKIISDYCIGSDGDVNSVFLFSKKPLAEIRSIILDPQSRTSNNLTRILCKHYWKIDPVFIGKERFSSRYDSDHESSDLSQADAMVLIGDRTFQSRKEFAYPFDLGGEWKRFTGLPFVFAVWASHRELSQDFQDQFNKALKWGLDHRQQVLDEILSGPDTYPDFDFTDYLFHKLSFDFNEPKRKALSLYLDFLQMEARAQDHPIFS